MAHILIVFISRRNIFIFFIILGGFGTITIFAGIKASIVCITLEILCSGVTMSKSFIPIFFLFVVFQRIL
jgi:hypothetical protein